MPTTLTLTEWQKRHDLQVSHAQARALHEIFGASTTLEPSSTAGDPRWCVTPSSIVGTAFSDGTQITIRPKTPVNNVLFLLGTAAGHKPDLATHDAVEVAEADDLAQGVAGLFGRVVERTLLQGVLRGYRTVAATRPTVRGRVDVAEQLRRRPGRGYPVAVRFEEHDEDILENQLLLAASRVLLRLRPELTAQRRLRRIVAALDDVSAVTFSPPVPATAPTPLNSRYRPAVELARAILAGAGLDLEAGLREAVGLTVNMNTVFEGFVSHVVGAALSSFEGQYECQDPRWSLDEGRVVNLQPDLVWYRDRGALGAVIDAKYKVLGNAPPPVADVYQMLAYCTALDLAVGHLVYTGSGASNRIVVRHGGPVIHVHRLDLSRKPSELLEDARQLAADIATAKSSRR